MLLIYFRFPRGFAVKTSDGKGSFPGNPFKSRGFLRSPRNVDETILFQYTRQYIEQKALETVHHPQYTRQCIEQRVMKPVELSQYTRQYIERI